MGGPVVIDVGKTESQTARDTAWRD
jgi:hypothetical protein